jgi:4-diphosphocytidyl-2-C-methyl-D-erythritol kinase
MREITRQAYGKINLGLDVTGKRDDGYHIVRMIMQTVELHDTLTFKENATGEITMTCDNETLPVDENNLCIRAAKLLKDEFGFEGGVDIHLKKRIPIAAGMAGGSTDAAAVLKAVNEIFELGLSKKELMKRGVKLGADIPYCIMGGTALAEGIGEELTRLSPMPDTPILIAKPPVNVSTGQVYGALDSLETYDHPNIDALMHSIEYEDILGIAPKMGNVLADVTMPMVPEIAEIVDFMESHGAVRAMMTGSGPTVFGIFEDNDKMEKCRKALEELGVCENLSSTSTIV